MKKRLVSYEQTYLICEKILNIIGEGTSREILSLLMIDYDIQNMNITPKGLTFYLKKQGYQYRKYYKTKPSIFFSKNIEGVILND